MLFTHTVAKPCLRASSASFTTSSRVASGLSRVWSMYGAMSADVRMRSGEIRAAPCFTIPAVPQLSKFEQTVQLDTQEASWSETTLSDAPRLLGCSAGDG